MSSLFDARTNQNPSMGGDDDEWRTRVNRDDAVQQLCVRDRPERTKIDESRDSTDQCTA